MSKIEIKKVDFWKSGSSDKNDPVPELPTQPKAESDPLANPQPAPIRTAKEDIIEMIENEDLAKANDHDVAESLSEIYYDDSGQLVDVRKIEQTKRWGWLFWGPMLFLIFSAVLSGIYFFYNQSLLKPVETDAQVKIISEQTAVKNGESVIFSITFGNPGNIALADLHIQASFPENFIFDSADPAPTVASSSSNFQWSLDGLEAFESGKISVRGKLAGPAGSRHQAFAEMSYQPANISSTLRANSSFEIEITDPGLEISIDRNSTVMVGAKNEMTAKIKLFDPVLLDNIVMKVESLNHLSFNFLKADNGDLPDNIVHSDLIPGQWKISSTSPEINIPIRFAVAEKQDDGLDVKFSLYYAAKGREHLLLEQTETMAVMTNDLNLSLIINGSREDKGVFLGDTLQYSIFYANKGNGRLEDVILQAVIEGGLTDWSGLKDENQGKVLGNSITWDKHNVPALEDLEPNSEGTINFSLPVFSQLPDSNAGENWEIRSYAHYQIGSSTHEEENNEKNKSNLIKNPINSDLKITEELRYFNEDNIAVGSGPLPPKAGQTTFYRVFWHVSSTIHELTNQKVSMILPDYVKWEGREIVSAGNLTFDNASRTIHWDVGRLPLLSEGLSAEFSVSLTPQTGDVGKVLVLIPGFSAQAVDSLTGAMIEKTGKAKTTRLEDDEIGGGGGQIEE